jgi:serine/threonine protein kinase/Leucine-rich repeat (LRR) protein
MAACRASPIAVHPQVTAMTIADFIADVRQHRLLEPAQLKELENGLLPKFTELKALAKELVQRDWLTPYQVNQLLQGHGAELLLGSYVLLERLGEGGMGAVFKARNWKLGHIVAIKLIRKERLESAAAVTRFQREIRACARLNHPNIVRAFDADEVAGTHLLVMELVDGFDLTRLVKKSGPLPVSQACDCIRQAASGLQHAHEHGLVHRDIKPGNLLLTAQGTVKILDMGLARWQRGATEDSSSSLTQEGSIMGSLDYIAPEQALDSHAVDIRADLYSLGCTFYFLLTSQPPFPGGEALAKLAKHQSQEPVPVEQLRSAVPPNVTAIVRTLMAKKPEDRYQTPAELVEALEGRSPVHAIKVGQTEPSLPFAVPWEKVTDAANTIADSVMVQGTRERKRRRWQLAAGVSVLLLSLLVFGGLLWNSLRPEGSASRGSHAGTNGQRPESATNSKAVKIVDQPFTDAHVQRIAALPAAKQVEEVRKELMKRNPGFDGKVGHKIEGGVVTDFSIDSKDVRDLAPVRALTKLKYFDCRNTPLSDLAPLGRMPLTELTVVGCQVRDLTPLKGMPLTRLNLNGCQIQNLEPLKGIPLTYLSLENTQVGDLAPLKGMLLSSLGLLNCPVSDLAPLKGMPLTGLDIRCRNVRDLTPLKGMALKTLWAGGSQVRDLTPLKGMPLTALYISGTQVQDLSLLKGMKLISLHFHGTSVSDLSPLQGMDLQDIRLTPKNITRGLDIIRDMKSLKTIGIGDWKNWPATEFWERYDKGEFGNAAAAFTDADVKRIAALPAAEQVEEVRKELMRRNPGFDGKMETKIEGGVVTELIFSTLEVTDISPVRALTGLRTLHVGPGVLADLSPLKGMGLVALNCANTKVSDFSPLKGMKLQQLMADNIGASDLTPLQGMPLKKLVLHGVRGVTNLQPLQGMPLDYLNLTYVPVRDLSPLAGMTSLRTLNLPGTPVSDLTPLQGLKLRVLFVFNTQVSDLSPLKGMALQRLGLTPRNITKGLDVLRDMKSLKSIQIGGAKTEIFPAAEFWARYDKGEFK